LLHHVYMNLDEHRGILRKQSGLHPLRRVVDGVPKPRIWNRENDRGHASRTLGPDHDSESRTWRLSGNVVEARQMRLIPMKARILTTTVAHPSRIYLSVRTNPSRVLRLNARRSGIVSTSHGCRSWGKYRKGAARGTPDTEATPKNSLVRY